MGMNSNGEVGLWRDIKERFRAICEDFTALDKMRALCRTVSEITRQMARNMRTYTLNKCDDTKQFSLLLAQLVLGMNNERLRRIA